CSTRSRASSRSLRVRALAWRTNPAPLALAGIVLSVLLIQLVMRQCFAFSNLLVADRLPDDPKWLSWFLLADWPVVSLYFDGLVACCLLTAGVLWRVRAAPPATATQTAAGALLAVLVAIQALLLPVNYGVLIVDKSFPRVSAIGGNPLAEGETAWLAWEGKDSITW